MKFLLPSGGPSFHTQVTGCFSHFMDLQLGLQFDVLMTDNLYWEIAGYADRLADKIRATLDALNVPYLVPTNTNQIFPVMSDEKLAELKKSFAFAEIERVDETHRCIRFCTSWATKEENVDALCAELNRLLG